MLNTKLLLRKRGLIISFRLPQVMTKNDCVPHGLQYYDLKYSTVCKDDGARKSSGQPFVDNCNKTPQAVRRECDSPDSNELFGPIWDNIDSNDGVTESIERHGTGLDHLTSEHVVNFLLACTFTDLDLSSYSNKVTMIWSIRTLDIIKRS